MTTTTASTSHRPTGAVDRRTGAIVEKCWVCFGAWPCRTAQSLSTMAR